MEKLHSAAGQPALSSQTITAREIFMLMYPWCWELFWEKILSQGSTTSQVSPTVCNNLAHQLRHVREGQNEIAIT